MKRFYQTVQYKYAHIFTIDSFLYNKTFQRLICEIQSASEHAFIYLNERSYSLVKDENLGKTVLNTAPRTVEVIRDALRIANIVFIHSMDFSNDEIAKLTDDEAGRCVWSVWGPDLYKNNALKARKNWIYEILRFWYRLLRYRHICTAKNIQRQILAAEAKINKFRAICAGFEGDIAEIKKRFPDVPVCQALYPSELFLHDIDSWKKEIEKNTEHHQKVRILLGHCAAPVLKHEKWLKILSAVKDSVEIYLPLNYGDARYAQKIEEQAKRIFGTSAFCYRNSLSAKDYFVQVLGKVDIAIFDVEIQNGYGNALLLMYLGKKVYYPENSVMYRGLSQNGAAVFKTESIESIDEKIWQPSPRTSENTSGNIEFCKYRLDKNTYIEQWNSVFRFLQGAD